MNVFNDDLFKYDSPKTNPKNKKPFGKYEVKNDIVNDFLKHVYNQKLN